MKIAVTYENGMIFQHFGHTEQFKIYEVAENAVVRAEVVNTNGSGHGALAGFLAQHGVDTLICGDPGCAPHSSHRYGAHRSSASVLVVADGPGAGNGAAQRGHAPV